MWTRRPPSRPKRSSRRSLPIPSERWRCFALRYLRMVRQHRERLCFWRMVSGTIVPLSQLRSYPLGEIGKENLNVILWAKLSLLSNVKVLNAVLESYDLLLVDLSYQDTLDDVPLSAAPKIVLLGSAKAAALFGSDRSEPTWKHKLTHRKLGGLTSCSQVFNWKGVDGHLVRLRHGSYPIRPLGKFVDIAADLPRGTTACELAQHEPFWNIDSLEPFPWPPASWPLSIRVPSVYLKGERVVRYLSSKEASRLFGVVMFLNLISFDVSICTMKV